MNSLSNWAKNKPYYIKLFALEIALFSNDFFQLLHSISENEISPNFQQPDLKAWTSFYRQNKQLSLFIGSQILASDQDATQTFYQGVVSANNQTERVLGKSEAELWETQVQSLTESNVDDVLKPVSPDVKQAVFSSEFYFILSVAVPSWLLFQEPPTLILRKAQYGNVEAMIRLLKLDKHMIENPRINKWFSYYQKHDLNVFEQLCDALKKPATGSVTLRSVKDCFAGLISVVSQSDGYRLTAPQINALFNSIASLREGSLIDESLPDSPESYSKVIQRQRKLWKRIFTKTGQN